MPPDLNDDSLQIKDTKSYYHNHATDLTHDFYELKRHQCRFILSEMGIDVWAAQKANIKQIHPKTWQNLDKLTAQLSKPKSVKVQNDLPQEDSEPSSAAPAYSDFSKDQDINHDYINDTLAQKDTKPQALPSNTSLTDSTNQITPLASAGMAFSLQGFCYGQWIVLVQKNVLSSPATELWQKMAHALTQNHQVHSLKFPFFAEINDQLTAQISVDGFLYALSQQGAKKVLALTSMPDGIQIPEIQTSHSLEDMLIHTEKKREIWQLLQSD